MREIVFDVETTGLNAQGGDRITEIGAVEVVDAVPTGREFQSYLNPERDVPREVEQITGLTAEFLSDKPLFAEVVDRFLDFVGDGRLVAHNASFDRGFIDMELARSGRPLFGAERFRDTLELARALFPGSYNSLDALCKRFNIALDGRQKHGALIDARLLARVYLELTGGRERTLDLAGRDAAAPSDAAARLAHPPRPKPLTARLTEAERIAHDELVASLGPDAIWLGVGGD